MNTNSKTRVAVNGYGVIGKRVADAVAQQEDMELAGVSDISADWRARVLRLLITSCQYFVMGPRAQVMSSTLATAGRVSYQ